MKDVRRSLYAVLLGALIAVPPAWALDLDTVLNDVVAANPSLAAQRTMVDAAGRRVGPAGAWPSPMLMAGAVNVPSGGGFDAEPMTMKHLSITQRVPLFGRTGLARRAAREGVEEASAANVMAHYEAFGMAWEAYARSYHAAERRRAAEAHQGVMARMVQSARARYESGVGRLDDVLRAQAEEARMYADIEMFHAEEREARAELDRLRGRTPDGAADSLAPPPAATVAEDPSAWQAAVSNTHPRLRELEALAESNRFAAAAVRRSAWPDLSLQFGWGFRETLADGRTQDDMWTAMVGIELPVFAGQRESQEGAERDAMARVAESRRQAETLRLQADVAAVHARARAALRTVGLMADTVVTTQQRALDASWSAYTAGTADLWRTLEAAHHLYVVHVELSRARESLARAEAQFLALTGRGDLLGITLPQVPGSES